MEQTEGSESTDQRRLSYFKEMDIAISPTELHLTVNRPQRRVRFRSQPDMFDVPSIDGGCVCDNEEGMADKGMVGCAESSCGTSASVSRNTYPTWLRILSYTLVFGVLLTLLHNSPLIATNGEVPIGAEGGVIRAPRKDGFIVEAALAKRANSPTDVCTRWAHQSALVNGTLYIYGGQATQHSQQGNDNTWNNDFLTLDLTKSWNTGTPTFSGLPQPSGPPAVSLGFLWNSFDSLFLYGGEYSSTPTETPTAPFSLWEYAIASSSWIQHSNPTTSSGTNSDTGNQAVQDVAEGAGVTVPELGRGWYFGGHQDPYTTYGWVQWIPRIYVKSMIEFTFPGFANKDIQSMSSGQTAGSDGAWRNITQGGIQSGDGFPERADGVLVYVPGYGPEGILLGLAGGTNATFDQMNVIDVFDIATSTWYTQATNGTQPSYRVDPCAVAFSAADGSSTNVYMYGGQNLIPAGEQVQYDDVWILTVPAFTWIKADTTGQGTPGPRAGHTCNAWNAQMVVVGGYVGPNQSCDYPGTYVFDASELKWVNEFTALTGQDAEDQQASQTQNITGLIGSYGYQVPAAVQAVIGGQASGGATVTAPANMPSSGPLATGKPIIYTVAGSNGATVTETATPANGGGGTSGGGGGTSSSSNTKGGPNIAAIVAGVVAGVLFIVCLYLGFCAWVYRRQLQLYKNHVAMSQRAAAAGPNEKTGFMFHRGSGENSSSARGKYSTDASSGPSGTRSSAINSNSHNSNGNNSDTVPPMPITAPVGGNSTANSSTEDLMTGQEPSFVGVLLNPRRSLRVINRD